MAKPTDELPDVPSASDPNHDGTQPTDAILNPSDHPESIPTDTKASSTEGAMQPKPPLTTPDEDSSSKETVDQEDPTAPSEPVATASEDDLPHETTEDPEDGIDSQSESDAEPSLSTSNNPDSFDSSEQVDEDNLDDFELDEDSMMEQVAGVFVLWWNWAFLEITVTSPNLPIFNPHKVIKAQPISGTDEHEFVYDICDWGFKLSTSKNQDMYSIGMSMCKLFYTIEKMIGILVQRLKDEGIDTDTEVHVSFDGHLLAQRKAFESIINLKYNLIVSNFEPGTWGERYLDVVKGLAAKGYGYPPEAPRDVYKLHILKSPPSKK